MSYSLSTFPNVYETVPSVNSFDDWYKLVDFLEAESHITSRSTPTDKRRTMCVTPALYAPGTTRRRENVVAWEWWALDIDNKHGNDLGVGMLDLLPMMEELGCPFLIHTTTSHRPRSDCYRLMFPISRPVTLDDFDEAWASIAQYFGCIDPQTKDPCRLFIVPRKWDSGYSVFVRHDFGTPLDVDEMVRKNPPVTHLGSKASKLLVHASSDSAKGINPTVSLRPLPNDMLKLDGELVNQKLFGEILYDKEGGRMFRFLMSVASRALRKGYDITTTDLEEIGHQLACRLGRGTGDIRHDARNALKKATDGQTAQAAHRFRRATQTNVSRWVVKRE